MLSFAIGCCIFYFFCKPQFDAIVSLQKNPPVFEEDKFVRIKLADFLILLRQENTLCIDIRENEYYIHGHIPQAIQLTEVISNKYQFQSVERVVLYGNSIIPHYTMERIIHDIEKYTNKDIVIYTGGWEEWKSCGLPIEVKP